MSRRGREDDDEEVEEDEAYDTEEEEEEERGGKCSRGCRGKRSRVESFIDDAASEDDDDEEEEEDDDDDHEGGRGRARKRKRPLFEMGGFIDDARPDIPDKDVGRSSRGPISMQDEEEDMDKIAELIRDRYEKPSHFDYVEEETTVVEQQALLPSVKDPKPWMVK